MFGNDSTQSFRVLEPRTSERSCVFIGVDQLSEELVLSATNTLRSSLQYECFIQLQLQWHQAVPLS